MCGSVRSIAGVITLASVVVLSGCAQRSEPAPVTRLYQGKTIHDFEPASLSGDAYVVEAGDTLYSIAFRANEDVRTLAQWNAIAPPYTIHPGQRLRITAPPQRQQAVASSTQPRSTTSTTASSTPPTTTKPSSNTQNVASVATKGYGEKKVTTNKNQQGSARTAATSSRTTSPPIRIEPSMPASKDIVWQWPATGQVLREFSSAETGSKGLDIAGSRGAPVYAAAAGKVVYAGNALKGYGQLIILKHNDDYITAYAHNQQLLVKEQQWVNKGDQIAAMGDTDAERVKLHFQVRFRGKSVNPRHYLPRGKQ